MKVIYLLLLIIAAVCFALATLVGPTTTRVSARVNLMAAGLLAWVLVPLIQQADRLND